MHLISNLHWSAETARFFELLPCSQTFTCFRQASKICLSHMCWIGLPIVEEGRFGWNIFPDLSFTTHLHQLFSKEVFIPFFKRLVIAPTRQQLCFFRAKFGVSPFAAIERVIVWKLHEITAGCCAAGKVAGRWTRPRGSFISSGVLALKVRNQSFMISWHHKN